MTTKAAVVTIPKDVAGQLCVEIREENRGKWFSLAAGQCWGCVKFSKGDPAKMCGAVVACNLVTARYARQSQTNRA